MKLPRMKASPPNIAGLIIVLLIIGLCGLFFTGPYTGTIIDADTGKPIEGASVLFYWTKVIPTPAGGVSGFIGDQLVRSDKKGSYRVLPLIALRGICGFFESTRVIVYEPGYQAYIVTLWNDSSDSQPARSFSHFGNIIKLRKIPDTFSYKEEYEAIDQALWGMEDNAEADREELLRRAEWEERWGRSESEKENMITTAWEERERLTEYKSRGSSKAGNRHLPTWRVVEIRFGTDQQKKTALSSLAQLNYSQYINNSHAFDPILRAMTKDGSSSVREAAAACLKRIGYLSNGRNPGTEIVPSLIVALKDRCPRVRGEAANALAYYRDNRAVAPLTQTLHDPDQWVRLNAAFALGEQADFRGLAPLQQMLSDGSDWRFRFCNREAEIAIKRLRTLLTFRISARNREFDKKDLWQEGFSSQGEMVSFLIEQLDDPRISGSALGSLGYYQDPRLFDIYKKVLRNGPDRLRWIAVVDVRDSLKRLKTVLELKDKKELVELLVPLLPAYAEPNRMAVAEILGMLGEREAVIPLTRTLLSLTRPGIKIDDGFGLRQKICEALGKIGDRRAFEALAKALDASLTFRKNDGELRRASIKALGLIRDTRAVPLLLEQLSSPIESIRCDAIEALGYMKDDRALNALLKYLDSTDEEEIWAIKALGTMKDKRAIKPMVRTTGNNRLSTLMFVAQALKQFQDPAMVETLIGLLSDSDKDVVEGALNVLAVLNDAKAIEPVERLLSKTKDSELKATASHALWRLRNKVPY